MSLIRAFKPKRPRRLFLGLGIFVTGLLAVLGVFASNGWLPRTDPMTGKRTGWFGRPVSEPGAVATGLLPSGTPQLNKEYIYAGGRLLAVEDANAGASPTPTPYGFEGDVAPRNLGDGTLATADIDQVRNFAVGLDTPDTATNEFQRADTAPRGANGEILGDGAIVSSDVTQTKRYKGGEDPQTPAGGPTGQGNAPEGAIENKVQRSNKSVTGSNVNAAANRELRVLPVTGRRGETITVPVQMKLESDEVAVCFTLEYDTAKLSNPQVTIGTDLPASAYLTVNTTQPGNIGILVDAEEPFSSSPREITIVYVTFVVTNTATIGSSQIALTSSIARQSVADRTANLVATSYVNGSVTIMN